MTTAPPSRPDDEIKKQKQQVFYNLLGERVMHTLGVPRNLLAVQVRSLWTNHFRVNVFVGPDAASARVAHSYFLVADGDGNILTSTPQLANHYGPA